MPDMHESKYFLVAGDMLPEIYIKVAKAKELIETGEAQTVSEAASAVGISRSAFYKYKDSITPFQDLKRGRIITFHISLRDRMGVLSSVLSVFADSGANILTINQSIPINGTALLTISAETTGMHVTTDQLLISLEVTAGVRKVEIIAG